MPSIKTIHQSPDMPSFSVLILMYHFVIKTALYANSGSGSLPHSNDVPDDNNAMLLQQQLVLIILRNQILARLCLV